MIQSLLLIRQTVKGDDPNLDLNFGNPDMGDSVTLGQFRDVLCRHGAATEVIRASQIGIEFRWSESGGAKATRLRRGFGSFVLERLLARTLGGEVRLEFKTEGVTCQFLIPSEQLIGK